MDDPRTFITLDACIQVARKIYGMIVNLFKSREEEVDSDDTTTRRFNPNNVVNFDESLGYTPYWYVHSGIDYPTLIALLTCLPGCVSGSPWCRCKREQIMKKENTRDCGNSGRDTTSCGGCVSESGRR